MALEACAINRKQILKMLESVLKTHQLFAPVPRKPHTFSNEKERGKQYFGLEEIRNKTQLQNIAFDYDTTILPPKKIFFPPEEVLLEYKNGKISEPKESEKPIFIFGAHLVDIYGVLQLDDIMTNPKPDYYYLKKRKNAVIIGISATFQQFDFSERWGIDKNSNVVRSDIFLEKTAEGQYLAIVGSKKGLEILKKIKAKKADKKIISEIRARNLMQSPDPGRIYDQDLLKKAIIASRNGKIWDELEKICMGCGICTYVCPLCYCFDIEDKTDYSTNICSRCRKWDACTLPTFAEIAGGKNFRPELKQRYFNWYFHKFVRGLEEYSQVQCVGCGRCSKFCPAGINVEQVLDKILEEYSQKLKYKI